MANIPQTITRLSQSLGILSVHQVEDSIVPINNIVGNVATTVGSLVSGVTQAAQLLKAGNPIGAVANITGSAVDAVQAMSDELDFIESNRIVGAAYGFTVRQSRSNIRRHGIDSPIEAFAIVPGVIITTLEIEQAALYIQDAMQAFAFDSGNIAFQTRPLIINEIVNPPDIPIAPLVPDIAKDLLNQIRGSGNSLADSAIVHTYIGCWLSDLSTEYKLQDDQMVVQNLKFDVARIINPTILEQAVISGQYKLAQNVRLTRAVSTVSQVTNVLSGGNPLRRS